MKKLYQYTICSLCKKTKHSSRSPYCKTCSVKYSRNYRLLKKLQPNINLKSLGEFIDLYKDGVYREDFLKAFKGILFFYEIISTNINEYDKYPAHKQVELMWKRINRYYIKETIKK